VKRGSSRLVASTPPWRDIDDAMASTPSQHGWSAAAALLVLEGLFLTLLFDAQPLRRTLPLLENAGPLVGLAVVFATTTYLATSLRRRPRPVLAPPGPRGRRILWVLHGVAYLALLAAIAVLTRVPEPSVVHLAVAGGFATLLLVALAASLVHPRGWGIALRAFGPELGAGVLVGLLAWSVGLAAVRLWGPLADATLTLVVAALSALLGDTVVYEADARIVGTEDFLVEVAPVCSGMEGLGLALVLSTVWIAVSWRELRPTRAWMLVPLALVAVYGANVLRIAALILIGSYVDADVAVEGFHSKAGWVLFCTIAIALASLARRSRFFARHGGTVEFEYPAAPYLAPLLVLLAVGMTTGLFAVDVDLLYGLRILAALIALAWFWPKLPSKLGSPSLVAVLLGVAAFGLWYLLRARPAPEDVDALRNTLASLPWALSAAWIAFKVGGSVLVVPVVEELAFRAFLLRRLESASFLDVPLECRKAWPLVGSSVAFGLAHSSVLAGTAAGLMFAFAQSWRGRTGDAIVAHVVANAGVAAAVLLGGAWWMWA
jgi:exosortase E/protease (VPEID-CTERM system)